MTDSPAEPESVVASRRDAWAALYDQYSVEVWRYVARIIGTDSEAVADAVQETFLAAARGFERFDPERGTAWAWLTGIAHRHAALHWRRLGGDRIDAGASFDEASSAGEVTSPLEQKETVDIVRRVLAALPPDSAAILTGKYCDGFSVAELIEQFGGTTEGVRSKLARARRDFKSRYEQASGDVAPQETLKELDTERT